ncbi:MAG: glycerol-3-phosphate dehydrogenase/oxidase [Candidatus Omnitrophota bacterium]
MKRDISRLKAEHFDLLVIGGGINGCAIARDAALRGIKTALIEKDDFAAGASGKTTKIIHGGIRYLEQFNLNLIYEALRERGILLRTVPKLVRPLEFIIPVYKGDPRPLIMMKTGVFIYDLLAGKGNIHCHRSLKKDEAAALESNITPQGLKGGVLYCDAQMDDIRLCLDNAISAYEAGSCVANKAEAEEFIKREGKITGAEARDRLTGERFSICARSVVNATGAWSNRIVRADEPNAPFITRPTKGIHLVYRKLPIARAMLFSARKDKRILFAIPWRDYTLIGTTDTDFNDSADDVYATSNDLEYLLEEARRVFPNEGIDKGGVITTYAGLRPLMNTQGIATWKVSREHLIKESASGLISVVGGKYTTYRRLAEQVVDLVLVSLRARLCWNVIARPEISGRSLPCRQAGNLFKKCITAEQGPSPAVSEERKGDLRSLIEHAVKDEMANNLKDLLIRRLQLATTPSLGLNELEDSAGIMAQLLDWTPARKESEIQAYKEEVRKNRECLK